ncbi:MAG: rhodanese-like domain-containing protein [Steroidobacteraceae bacterium]
MRTPTLAAKSRATHRIAARVARTVLALALIAVSAPAFAGYTYVRADTIPASARIEPGALVALLDAPANERPLVLQVGAKVLYDRSHVPGAEYIGPGEDDDGIAALRARVTKLPRSTFVVIYCGCCPWDHCRNVGGAWAALARLGFTNVKVLYLPSDFDSNWVDLGYPVARGDAVTTPP